ncbi:MAG: hypothetical protein ACREJT_15555 [Myxococcota bacterium]
MAVVTLRTTHHGRATGNELTCGRVRESESILAALSTDEAILDDRPGATLEDDVRMNRDVYFLTRVDLPRELVDEVVLQHHDCTVDASATRNRGGRFDPSRASAFLIPFKIAVRRPL